MQPASHRAIHDVLFCEIHGTSATWIHKLANLIRDGVRRCVRGYKRVKGRSHTVTRLRNHGGETTQHAPTETPCNQPAIAIGTPARCVRVMQVAAAAPG